MTCLIEGVLFVKIRGSLIEKIRGGLIWIIHSSVIEMTSGGLIEKVQGGVILNCVWLINIRFLGRHIKTEFLFVQCKYQTEQS